MIRHESHQGVHLTPRQIQVLEYDSHGMTDKKIADIIGITRDTVKGYQYALRARLGASNRTDSVVKAYAAHILELEPG